MPSSDAAMAVQIIERITEDAIAKGLVVRHGHDDNRPYALAAMPNVWLSAFDLGAMYVKLRDGVELFQALADIVAERAGR